jgi:hypothetical protein
MDPLMALFSILLAASASMFFWLSLNESRQAAAGLSPSGPAVALEDLVGARRPLLPRTIRHTPLD